MMWWAILAVCATVLAAVVVYWVKKAMAAMSEWFDEILPGGDDYGDS